MTHDEMCDLFQDAVIMMVRKDFEGLAGLIKAEDDADPSVVVSRLRAVFPARYMVPSYAERVTAARDSLNSRGLNGDRLLRGLF